MEDELKGVEETAPFTQKDWDYMTARKLAYQRAAAAIMEPPDKQFHKVWEHAKALPALQPGAPDPAAMLPSEQEIYIMFLPVLYWFIEYGNDEAVELAHQAINNWDTHQAYWRQWGIKAHFIERVCIVRNLIGSRQFGIVAGLVEAETNEEKGLVKLPQETEGVKRFNLWVYQACEALDDYDATCRAKARKGVSKKKVRNPGKSHKRQKPLKPR